MDHPSVSPSSSVSIELRQGTRWVVVGRPVGEDSREATTAVKKTRPVDEKER